MIDEYVNCCTGTLQISTGGGERKDRRTFWAANQAWRTEAKGHAQSVSASQLTNAGCQRRQRSSPAPAAYGGGRCQRATDKPASTAASSSSQRRCKIQFADSISRSYTASEQCPLWLAGGRRRQVGKGINANSTSQLSARSTAPRERHDAASGRAATKRESIPRPGTACEHQQLPLHRACPPAANSTTHLPKGSRPPPHRHNQHPPTTQNLHPLPPAHPAARHPLPPEHHPHTPEHALLRANLPNDQQTAVHGPRVQNVRQRQRDETVAARYAVPCRFGQADACV